MEPIGNEVFRSAIMHWRGTDDIPEATRKQMIKESTQWLSYSTFVLDPKSPEHILGMDHFSMRTFRILKNAFWQVELGMSYLITHKVHFREGFVDKSLNTEVFSRVEEFKFTIGDFEFGYKEFKLLVTALCTPKKNE